MANETQQNDAATPSDSPQLPPVAVASLGVRGASRRRFARAGAGATGVLMTLVSQPGMACSVCRAPSGYQSVKANPASSNKIDSHLKCEGVPPKTWYTQCTSTTSWKNTPFGSVFNCKYGNATVVAIGGKTAYELLGLWDDRTVPDPAYRLAMWLTAAYLNVASGKSQYLTYDHLLGMWNGYRRDGTYTPAAAVTPWTIADMITYLSKTMD